MLSSKIVVFKLGKVPKYKKKVWNLSVGIKPLLIYYRSPNGVEYKMEEGLDRDGVSCYCQVSINVFSDAGNSFFFRELSASREAILTSLETDLSLL